MSKVVKEFMIRDYQDRVGDCQDAVLISIRGIPANKNNAFRQKLKQQNIQVTVIRNGLAKHAFADSGLSGLGPLLEGPSALAYGAESVVDVARALVKWTDELEQLELKGAVLDGQLFEGKAGVERLSKFPTRDEAIAEAVTLILSPGRKLMGAVKGPGGRLMGIVKAIEEKLEKGETIAKVG
ncbi:MAG: 50S ribosomal protein L10 [Phycisphaerales bacterium]